MNSLIKIKAGDTIVLAGTIKVKEGSADVSNDQDFEQWLIEAEAVIRGTNDRIDLRPSLNSAGAFVARLESARTAVIVPGSLIDFDIRLRTPVGDVVSSHTRTVLVDKPISETP